MPWPLLKILSGSVPVGHPFSYFVLLLYFYHLSIAWLNLNRSFWMKGLNLWFCKLCKWCNQQHKFKLYLESGPCSWTWALNQRTGYQLSQIKQAQARSSNRFVHQYPKHVPSSSTISSYFPFCAKVVDIFFYYSQTEKPQDCKVLQDVLSSMALAIASTALTSLPTRSTSYSLALG